MCDRDEGKLVDGKLPIDESEGATTLATDKDKNYVWAQSTDPRGNPSLAVAFACNEGGVAWPQTLGFYNTRGDLIASLDLGRYDKVEHSVVSSIQYRGGVFRIDWLAYDGAEFGPCNQTSPDEQTADAYVSDGKVLVVNFNGPCTHGE